MCLPFSLRILLSFKMHSVFAAILLSLIGANAFYLPGLAPVTYCEEESTASDSNDCKVGIHPLTMYSVTLSLPHGKNCKFVVAI